MNGETQPTGVSRGDEIPYHSAYFGCCNRTVMTREDIAQPRFCPFCGKAIPNGDSKSPSPATPDSPLPALERAREAWNRAVEKRGNWRNKGKTLAIFAVEEFAAELTRCEAEVRERTLEEAAQLVERMGLIYMTPYYFA